MLYHYIIAYPSKEWDADDGTSDRKRSKRLGHIYTYFT